MSLPVPAKTRNTKRNWWANQWLHMLEGFGMGQYLARGRAYIRANRISNQQFDGPKFTAHIDNGKSPCIVNVQLAAFEKPELEKIRKALSSQIAYSAQLLSGIMPADISDLFKRIDLSLFPNRQEELKAACSCGMKASPCDHIGAVYHWLGLEIDQNPFLLLRLRGIQLEDLLPQVAAQESPVIEETKEEPVKISEPLQCDPSLFWHGVNLPKDFFGKIQPPSFTAALPRRLGSFPFWQGHESFLEALEPYYKQASEHGVSLFLCDPAPFKNSSSGTKSERN